MRIAVVILGFLASAPLAAGVMVTGNSHARGCFEAAEQKSDSRKGLRQCDSALRDDGLAPDDRVATLVNRGIVQMQARNPAAAIADYDAAIAARPDAAEAWVNKGLAYLAMGDHDAEAAQTLSEAIARNPARPAHAYFARANAYEGMGRLRDAYEDYARAAALEPGWDAPAVELERFKVVKGKTLQG